MFARLLAGRHPLVLSAGVIWGANALGFTATALTHTHKLTDLTGTGAFVLSAWTTFAAMRHTAVSLGKPLQLRPLLLTVAVSFWGFRLGGFLFHRIVNSPKDSRLSEFFPGPGELPIRLAGFWNIQASWAFFTLLPVTMAHRMPTVKVSGGAARGMTYVGWSLFALGFACEVLADHQKSQFKARPGNSEAFCDEGIWQFSRHPNYFGELTLWWGLWMVAAPYVPRWTIVSPLWVSLLILGISGVPIMENKYDSKFAGDHPLRERYAKYKASTSLLVPLPKF
jgi:steroid 5-alpha reductase family enzyme